MGIKKEYRFIVKIDPAIWESTYTYVKWLSVNRIFDWEYSLGRFYFKHEEDSTAFKLAWL